MSGPKQADVQLKLDRALQAIQVQLDQCAANNARIEGIAQNAVGEAAQQADRAVAELPESVEGTPEEVAAYRQKREAALKALADAKQAEDTARAAKNAADGIHNKAKEVLVECMAECAVIHARIQGRAHYLHAEDAQALAVRGKAEAAVAQQVAAGRKIQEAAEAQKWARNFYDRAILLARGVQDEGNRLKELQRQREEAQRISEQNQRDATEFDNRINAARAQIQKLQAEKFAPGKWSPLAAEIGVFQLAFGQEDFAAAAGLGRKIVDRVEKLFAEIADAQQAWEFARKAAQNEIEAAEAEVQGVDQNHLQEWADNPQGLADIQNRMVQARGRFDKEEFSGVAEHAQAAVAQLRACIDVADANLARYEQREEIGNAIMQALYDQNYDTPEWYFAERDSRGNDKKLGEIVIFAQAPGAKGDMRMQINLDGNVNLELQNVPEGEEQLCHELIRGLQDGLADVCHFEMKDWGRADGARPQRVQVQQKQRDITREREGG